jgi:hypothetical protein
MNIEIGSDIIKIGGRRFNIGSPNSVTAKGSRQLGERMAQIRDFLRTKSTKSFVKGKKEWPLFLLRLLQL